MPTTSNFGWTTPADTDLVKDGAAAIRTLGNGIDASFLDLKGGTTNQVLAKNSNTDLDFKWVADATGIPATIFDAKGDIIAATAADTADRLASSGVNGDVLTVDTSTSTGLKWATPASGGMTSLATGSMSGSGTITINSISGSYRNLLLVLDDWGLATSSYWGSIRLNNDTSAIYDRIGQQINNSGSTSTISTSNGTGIDPTGDTPSEGNKINSIIMTLDNYASSTAAKTGSLRSVYDMATNSYGIVAFDWGYASATAITRIDLVLAAGTFTSGTYTLYGVK